MPPVDRASFRHLIDSKRAVRAHYSHGFWKIQLLEQVPNPDTRSANKFVEHVAKETDLKDGDAGTLTSFFSSNDIESAVHEFSETMRLARDGKLTTLPRRGRHTSSRR